MTGVLFAVPAAMTWDFLNSFDFAIVSFFNHFARRQLSLDALLVELGRNSLLKSGVLMALAWWLWLRPDRDQTARREQIAASIASGMSAALVSRLLGHVLPYRARPVETSSLDFVKPLTMVVEAFSKITSFPSDHAAAGFGFATGLLFASPALGLTVMAYVLVFVCLPRVYLGYHWPTDILGGAALGLVAGCLLSLRAPRRALGQPAKLWLERSPHTFYPAMFLLTFQVATNFDDARSLVRTAKEIARGLVR